MADSQTVFGPDSSENRQLRWELEEAEGDIARSRRRRPLIGLLYRGYLGGTGKVGCRRPSFAELERSYEGVVQELNRRHPLVRSGTDPERSLFAEIKRHTRLKVYTSMWIGTGNVDLFLPGLATSATEGGHQGLAIEVDGSIHDREPKMRKDAHKAEVLHRLGIAVMSVPNGDIRHRLVKKAIADLKTFRPLDTRGRKRVLTRVYLETLVCYLPDAKFSELFGVSYLDGNRYASRGSSLPSAGGSHE